MTNYGYKQNSYPACEEIWVAAGRSADAVVCPKPRRARLSHAAVESRHARPHMRLEQEECEMKAGNELLDIFRASGGRGPDQSFDSPPPFFSGSPPSRVSNPLVQDVRFGDDKFLPNAAGCVRANFGNSPAVRVEGFDRLDRDRSNCNIPTLA